MNDGMISIVKTIASQERALAALASSEAARLEALVASLLQGPHPSWTGENDGILEAGAHSVFHSIKSMQILLESKLARLETAFNTPLVNPPHSSCADTRVQNLHMLACGQGTIIEKNDIYTGGCGKIQTLEVVVRDGLIIDGKFYYQVERQGLKLSIRALPGTLHISFPSPCATIIGGRSIIKKIGSKKNIDNGCFSLTLINSGDDITGHKFRMLVQADNNLSLHHDSGLSILTGVIEIKYSA